MDTGHTWDSQCQKVRELTKMLWTHPKGRSASSKDWPNLELFEHKMKLESVKMEIYKLTGDRERW